MHSGKFIFNPIQLNKIIQVSYNIMNSLKLIFVLSNAFCLVIVTIYFKM